MIYQTIQTLLPVFAVIGLGYLLATKGFLSRQFLEELNKLVYFICLPSLIVVNLDRATRISAGSLPIIFIYFLTTITVILIAIGVSRLLKQETWQRGTFVQGAFRGNLAFIGLPILIFSLRDVEESTREAIIAQGIFVFAPIMILYNMLSVIVLSWDNGSGSGRSMWGTTRQIASNPLIIAAMAGLCLYLLPVDIPMFAGETLKFIGRTAAPMALICVGGGMAITSMKGRYRSATYAACIKVFITPAIAWLISIPFNLGQVDLLILMIFTATPTAIASYIMAKQMGGDDAMASGAIILSTLFSMVSLSVVVTLF